MQRILVVEDDFDIQELLQNFLQEAGYEVAVANDGVEALSLFAGQRYDLIVLDIMLPKIDGYGVCELIRKQSDVPIIMLTALSGEEDQIKGLDLQVDDYITKPFSMPVLLRKIAAVLRRSNRGTDEKYQIITYGNLLLNCDSYTATVDGANFELTQMYQETAVLQKSDEDTLFVLAVLNTKVARFFLSFLAPTLNFQLQDICAIPLPEHLFSVKNTVIVIGEKCVERSREDWDSFETSWDYKQHPLVALRGNYEEVEVTLYQDDLIDGIVPVEYSHVSPPIQQAFEAWERLCDERFDALKSNEEELNRIFIDIYGLQDELTPEVEDKDVTVRRADLGRDIRSLISYAVGCMFGRYSLDEPGLAYAGGEWSADKYDTFPADKDNIIPICDDEYFEDDIVGRFVKFVETVYGSETLDENLKFIAGALGGKGQPKDVIRNYFLNDFYNDHCRIYQKRPIYWQFDSGKKNGFKCLIYMHRYQPDTIARIRTDYVHEQQSRYRTAIEDLEQRIASAATSERVKLNKKLKTIQDQASELHTYEEKIHHLADQMIPIDLDDGVKVNYAKFQDVLAKIK